MSAKKMIAAYKALGMMFRSSPTDQDTEYLKALLKDRGPLGYVLEDWISLMMGHQHNKNDEEILSGVETLFPSRWTQLARLVANDMVKDVTFGFCDDIYHYRSFRFDPDLTFITTKAEAFGVNNAIRDYFYAKMLEEIQNMIKFRNNQGREILKYIERCQNLGLVRDIKLQTDKNVSLQQLTFRRDDDNWETFSFVDGWSFAELKASLEKNILSHGISIVEKSMTMPIISINRRGVRKFMIYYIDKTVREINVPENEPDCYGYLNSVMAELPASPCARTLRLDLQPPEPAIVYPQFFFHTALTKTIGIYSIRDFDPAKVVLENGTLYARRGTDSQDLDLDAIYTLSVDDESRRWYLATLELGKVLKADTKYVIISNPVHADMNQAALDVFKSLGRG